MDKNIEFLVGVSCMLHWRDVQMELSGFKRTNALYFNSTLGTFIDQDKIHNFIGTAFIYTNSIHKDFHKVIMPLRKTEEYSPRSPFYVQYYFDNDKHRL